MKYYHVYATAKPVAAVDFQERMKEFLYDQITCNHLHGYSIIRYDINADSGGMSEYHVICDYASDDDLREGFEGMRPDRWKQDPHAGMMEMVGEFRLALSTDVSRSDVRYSPAR